MTDTMIVSPSTSAIVTKVFGFASIASLSTSVDKGKGVFVDIVVSRAQQLREAPRQHNVPLVVRELLEHEVVIGDDSEDDIVLEPPTRA